MDFWQKQSPDKPLFENLLWSRPENKKHAGKLLIIGGQKENFSHVSKAYQNAVQSGAGQIKVLMPSSLQKFAGVLPEAYFAPSNKSGGFAENALAEMLDMASWADGVLLAGDLGKNSETHVVLDKFVSQFSGQLCLSSGSFESLSLDQINRDKTVLVCDLSGLQKFALNTHFVQAFTSNMGVVKFAEVLSIFSKTIKPNLVCVYDDNYWVAVDGKISSTRANQPELEKISSCSAVWLMQNPNKPFEALTVAVYESR